MSELGENRRWRRDRRRQRRDVEDRRQLNLGAPPTSTLGNVIDLVFFRLLGVALIANEVLGKGSADWHVLIAGFGAFFMPDALRGRSSPVVRAAIKGWLSSAANRLDDVSDTLDDRERTDDVSGPGPGEEDRG